MRGKPAQIAAKVCFLALIGFVLVILAAPIIVLLVFGAIGWAGYILVLGLSRFKYSQSAQKIASRGRNGIQLSMSRVSTGAHRGIHAIRTRLTRKPDVAMSGTRLSWIAKLAFEAACGAGVGAILSGALLIYLERTPRELEPPMAISMLAGAILGLLLGASRARRRQPHSQENY